MKHARALGFRRAPGRDWYVLQWVFRRELAGNLDSTEDSGVDPRGRDPSPKRSLSKQRRCINHGRDV